VGEYHYVLRQLGRAKLVSSKSMVIAEHSRQARLEECYGPLLLTRVLRQGDSQLAFYCKASTTR
jgi:hypothetical protein